MKSTAAAPLCNPKQQRFVDAYLTNGGKGKAAVIAAGYTCRNPQSMATQLLHKSPAVRSAIAAAQQASTSAALVSFDDNIRSLLRVVQSRAKRTKDADRIAAVREINRMMGFIAPERHEHTGPDGKPIQSVSIAVSTTMSPEIAHALTLQLIGAPPARSIGPGDDQ